MQVNVKIINAFSTNNTGGNPAGVLLNADELTNEQKQDIALKLGLSETAFVSSSVVADFKLEFFTPVKQIAHCGHATIAALSYMKQTGIIKQNNSSKETIDGTRKIYFEGNDAFMEQKAPSYQIITDFKKAFLESLDLQNEDMITGLTPAIVNTGNSFFIAIYSTIFSLVSFFEAQNKKSSHQRPQIAAVKFHTLGKHQRLFL